MIVAAAVDGAVAFHPLIDLINCFHYYCCFDDLAFVAAAVGVAVFAPLYRLHPMQLVYMEDCLLMLRRPNCRGYPIDHTKI